MMASRAANGGLDLEMPSAVYMTPKIFFRRSRAGQGLHLATIDDKVRRILRKAIQFGFLDHGQWTPAIPLTNQHSREVALERGAEAWSC